MANAAADDRAHGASYKSGAATCESAIVGGSADTSSNTRAKCTSDQDIGGADRFAWLEAHFAHSILFVDNLVWNVDNQDAWTAACLARTDQLVFGCAQKITRVANETTVIADRDSRSDREILDCLSISALRKAERTEKKGNDPKQQSFLAAHGIAPFRDERLRVQGPLELGIEGFARRADMAVRAVTRGSAPRQDSMGSSNWTNPKVVRPKSELATIAVSCRQSEKSARSLGELPASSLDAAAPFRLLSQSEARFHRPG